MPMKKKKKVMDAQGFIDEVEEDEAEQMSAQELVESVEDKPKTQRTVNITEISAKGGDTARLQQEIAKLEAEEKMQSDKQKQMAEKKRLEKRLKQLKFQRTTLGKVTGVVGKGFETITRPEIKDKKTGKVIQEGGIASKIMKSLTAPKPSPRQAVQQRIQRIPVSQGVPRQATQSTVYDTQAQIDALVNFGIPKQPMNQTMMKSKVKGKMMKKKMMKQPKPINMTDFINSLPQ